MQNQEKETKEGSGRVLKFRAWNPQGDMLTPYVPGDGTTNETLIYKAGWPIMQYTGLLDKNGKEIYEGDICKDDTGHFMEIKFGPLPLDKGGDCVCTYPAFYAEDHGKLGEPRWHECMLIGDWFEVIGNIWEQPELLD